MLDWLIMLKTTCSSEEKLNYVLKAGGYKLFKDFLTNKTFSEQILYWWTFVEIRD